MKSESLCLAIFIGIVMVLMASTGKRTKYLIGVSQCSGDIWRDKLNDELMLGGYVDDEVKLEFLSAGDNDHKQIEQIRHFISEKVDLLIVAPNSAEHLCPVIDSAYDCGIPVVLFDRKTRSDKFTAYMGADNYEIGHTMGKLIATQMNGAGTLVEITGLKGSSPAMERHRGFQDAIADYPQIRLVSSELGDWTQESGRRAMEEVLGEVEEIDCVFGHNDRLAMGARAAALAHGMKDIKYYGVDALPTPGGGIELVQQGVLEATYIYPTQGLELMRLSRRILRGEKFARQNILQSTVVNKENAELLLMQYREFERINADIEQIHGRVDEYFTQVNIQQKVIAGFIIVLVIIIGLVVLAYRFYLAKVRVHEEVASELAAPILNATQPDEVSEPVPAVSDTFLERFRHILQQHLHQADFNVERIGEEMGMSRVQLYRRIKSLTGMTPVELLRKARVTRGKQLLETTDYTISEIAYKVGFTAPSYFAKCFKEEFGTSPGEHRGKR